jgi:hypothetical protein
MFIRAAIGAICGASAYLVFAWRDGILERVPMGGAILATVIFAVVFGFVSALAWWTAGACVGAILGCLIGMAFNNILFCLLSMWGGALVGSILGGCIRD